MMDELNHPNIGAMIDTIPMALAGEHPEDYLKNVWRTIGSCALY